MPSAAAGALSLSRAFEDGHLGSEIDRYRHNVPIDGGFLLSLNDPLAVARKVVKSQGHISAICTATLAP